MCHFVHRFVPMWKNIAVKQTKWQKARMEPESRSVNSHGHSTWDLTLLVGTIWTHSIVKCDVCRHTKSTLYSLGKVGWNRGWRFSTAHYRGGGSVVRGGVHAEFSSIVVLLPPDFPHTDLQQRTIFSFCFTHPACLNIVNKNMVLNLNRQCQCRCSSLKNF